MSTFDNDPYRDVDPATIKAAISLTELIAGDGHEFRKDGGNQVTRCMFHVERSPSFTVFDDNHFKCFGCGAGGDHITYWRWTRNMSFPEAKRDLAQIAGIGPGCGPVTPRRPVRSAQPSEKPLEPIDDIPQWVLERLIEGGEGHEEWISRLAKWRGWPEPLTRTVVTSGLISFAKLLPYGLRAVAFPVVVPEPKADDVMSLRLVGAHGRAFPENSGPGRAPWFFRPTKDPVSKLGGVPSLPVILGDFQHARLIAILEGGWDAVSLCMAEGWIGETVAIPAGVCIVGIRGAQGANPFLRYYKPVWPKAAEALLFCDNDADGTKWTKATRNEASFLDRVRGLCSRATAISMGEPYKDISDAYKGGAWLRGSLEMALESAGFNYKPE